MPLPTFRDANNRYCREFESSLSTAEGAQVSYGAACRNQDVWQPLALMARQLISSSLRGGPAADHSQYVPAMGADVAGFDAIIDALMTGEPVSPEEEAALIEQNWRRVQ